MTPRAVTGPRARLGPPRRARRVTPARLIATAIVLAGVWAGLAAEPRPARADEGAAGWAALAAGGHVVAIRHARTSGSAGDPPGFRADDCATQRNLTEAGREQARRLGARFAERRVRVDRVLSSAWCRCRDTARLLGLGPVELLPALDNLFGRTPLEPERTERTRTVVAGWRGPGTLVLVSHGVNILPLTGLHPAEGEGIVLRPREGTARGFEVVGRVGAE